MPSRTRQDKKKENAGEYKYDRQEFTQLIRETIENTKTLKVLRNKFSKEKSEINKLKNTQGQISAARKEILHIVKEFYK